LPRCAGWSGADATADGQSREYVLSSSSSSSDIDPAALNALSAVEAAARIAAGTLSSEQLVGACLARIAAREADVLAWAHLGPELALAQARERDAERARGVLRGPLHGLPIGVKDVIDTAALPTEYGTPIWRGHRPRADAACVVAAVEQGAVVLGKTVSTELANRHPAITRNPRDLSRTPGGSSSGSAAAVADHMVPLAFGTQTGGSLIRPASYCGVVGYKPSYGSINPAGVKLLAPSLDTIGVYGRDVADAALFGAALIGFAAPRFDDSPFAGPAARAPRIAVYRTAQWPLAEPHCAEAFDAAVHRLAGAGAQVSELAPPPAFDAIIDASQVINDYETRRSFSWEFACHRDQLTPTLAAKLEQAQRWTHADYVKALRIAHDCRAMLTDTLRGFDVLITPGAEGEAPVGLENIGKTAFHQIWTLLHVPSVAIPVLRGPHGMPIGVQVVAAEQGDERALLGAAWVSRALGR
jgi:Asp-tRNA(Asn)/Glu-tRNA(Gln) amidotransferase A subunit family amidase